MRPLMVVVTLPMRAKDEEAAIVATLAPRADDGSMRLSLVSADRVDDTGSYSLW